MLLRLGPLYHDGCVMDDGSGAVSHAETCYIVTCHTCHVSRVEWSLEITIKDSLEIFQY